MTAFQSTLSVWRETSIRNRTAVFCRISIHSLRVERDEKREYVMHLTFISIHSLRVERDFSFEQGYLSGLIISIHSLRVERDVSCSVSTALQTKISILSLRVERDRIRNKKRHIFEYFNPLSPCGERRSSDFNIYSY